MSKNGPRQRIGLYGGTFDPIHIGHLLIAEQVREQLQLAQVRFIPAATAPHKQDQRASQAKHRLEMLRLATCGNPSFVVDDCELQRGGTSYTVDTLEALHRESPDVDWVLIIGGDSLDEFHTWRDPARICELAFVAVVARGGRAALDMQQLQRYLPEHERPHVQRHRIAMPQIEISSSDIRTRLAQSRSVRYQVHPAVEAYIAAEQIYVGVDR